MSLARRIVLLLVLAPALPLAAQEASPPPVTPAAGFTASGWRAARSRHAGGVNLLLGDGSVRFVRDSVAPATWMALGTRAGGEVLGDY